MNRAITPTGYDAAGEALNAAHAMQLDNSGACATSTSEGSSYGASSCRGIWNTIN